jgi:SAM-dependent methyltransferase
VTGVPPHTPDKSREIAESFGSDPARYDRARPRYPRAMVGRIVATSPGGDVLDVGTGTGIAARQFRDAGCKVLGVDADDRMAYVAREDGLEVEVARFEAWDPEGRTFDAVVSGQSWHWIDPAGGAAKAAEVLRRNGRLAAFWNVFQPPPDLAEAFSAVHRRTLPDSPFDAWARPALDMYSPLFVKAADGIREEHRFGDPEEWRFDWRHSYSRDEWLEQVPTFGGYANLRPSDLEELLRRFGLAVDDVGGSFEMAYTTVVVTAVRKIAA